DAPEFIGILSRLEGVNEGLFWRLLATSDPAERVALMRGIADEIRRGGNLSEDQIAHTLREVGSLVGRIETRFGLEIEHARNLALHAAEVAALPPAMRMIVEESPLALHLLVNPQLVNGKGESLFEFYSRRAAKRKRPITSGLEFDQFVMRSIQRTRKDTVLA